MCDQMLENAFEVLLGFLNNDALSLAFVNVAQYYCRLFTSTPTCEIGLETIRSGKVLSIVLSSSAAVFA